MNFDKIIIWGHKLHSHTHSYIHNGFFIAFKHLNYNVLWLDDNSNITNIDFTNSLFVSEHQVCKKMPIRIDCKYILHNSFVDPGKAYYKKNAGTWEDIRFKHLAEKGNVINMQVYRPKFVENKTKMEDYVYYDISTYTLYFPWATDLLPHEINEIQKNLNSIKSNEKRINFVGTIVDEWKQFKKACTENNISFIHLGGYKGRKRNISLSDNIKLIQESYIAPAIQRQQQCDVGYIPCRIFKNISYGKMGFTNSKIVYELFDKKIIYNPCPYKLFYDAKNWIENDYNREHIIYLMNVVKTKHTYLNRINNIFNFFTILNNTLT